MPTSWLTTYTCRACGDQLVANGSYADLRCPGCGKRPEAALDLSMPPGRKSRAEEHEELADHRHDWAA